VLETLENQYVVPKLLNVLVSYATVHLDAVTPWTEPGHNEVERHARHLSSFGDNVLEMSTEVKLPSTSTYNNQVPQETFRVLIGWGPKESAVQARSTLIHATPNQHSQAVSASRAQVASRRAFTPINPITEIEENDLTRAIKATPEYVYIETEVTNAGGKCRLALVNLETVLAFQNLVRVDHLDNRQVQGSLSDEQLYEMCFPASRPVSGDEVMIVHNGNGYTLTTFDPNIRVSPLHCIPGAPQEIKSQLQYTSASSSLEMQLLPFSVLRAPNYLQIVHYQDRYVMRNGYTRAVEILLQSIHTVPSVLIETQKPELIGFKPGMFDLGIILSNQPPRLPDFWDDKVSCLMQRPALHYVHQISMNTKCESRL